MPTKNPSIALSRAQKASHPALSFEAMARVRTAPKGGSSHVQLEAVELANVVTRARFDLERRSAWHVVQQLDELDHHERLSVVLYACGLALRVPVCVRGGIDDSQGRTAPGNGLGILLAAARGLLTPFSGQTARRACVDGHEAGTLARAARLQRGAWTDDEGRAWRQRFVRGLVYVPADRLRALYVGQAWHELAGSLARALPAAWKRAAFLRRKSGGYWAAIRPDPKRPVGKPPVSDAVLKAELREGRSFHELVAKHGFVPFARIRLLLSQIKEAWRIKRTKRVRRTEQAGSGPSGPSTYAKADRTETRETGPCAARTAVQRAGQGGGCPTRAVDSGPRSSDPPARRLSFFAGIAEYLGADHPLFHEAPEKRSS